MNIDILVDAYNQSAICNGVKLTDRKGLARRLANAYCGFKKGDEHVTEQQVQALCVTAYRGSQAKKDKQIFLFNEIAAMLLMETNFAELAMATDNVADKDMKEAARVAKRALDQMMKRALVSKAIREMNLQKLKAMKAEVPCSDAERIDMVKNALSKLDDKSMLYNLFALGIENEEAVR